MLISVFQYKMQISDLFQLRGCLHPFSSKWLNFNFFFFNGYIKFYWACIHVPPPFTDGFLVLSHSLARVTSFARCAIPLWYVVLEPFSMYPAVAELYHMVTVVLVVLRSWFPYCLGQFILLPLVCESSPLSPSLPAFIVACFLHYSPSDRGETEPQCDFNLFSPDF